LLICPQTGNLFAQPYTIMSATGLTVQHIPVAQGSGDIEDGGATESGGLINAPAGFSGASLLTQAVNPPVSNGQGLVTVQVKNSGNSMMATSANSLACWDGLGGAQLCGGGASQQIIGVVYSIDTVMIGMTSVYYSEIVRMGTVACTFSGTAPTPGHFVVAGATPGTCADATGAAPTQQVIGVAMSNQSGMTAYIFAMNDLMSGLVPTVTSLDLPTANGGIAYDTTNERYAFGTTIGTTAITENPVVALPPTFNASDTVSATTTSPQGFAAYPTIPGNLLITAGRTIRLNYQFALTTAGTMPSITFALRAEESGSGVNLYESGAVAPASVTAGTGFTGSCLITATTAPTPGTAVTVFANCSLSMPGGTFKSVANTLALSAIQMDTSAAQKLVMTIQYGAITTGNSIQQLAVSTEVIN
jgi:hypothetical protein